MQCGAEWGGVDVRDGDGRGRDKHGAVCTGRGQLQQNLHEREEEEEMRRGIRPGIYPISTKTKTQHNTTLQGPVTAPRVLGHKGTHASPLRLSCPPIQSLHDLAPAAASTVIASRPPRAHISSI